MKKELALVAVLVMLCASAITVWVVERQQPQPSAEADTEVKPELLDEAQRAARREALLQLSPAEIRERFHEIPKRLSWEMFNWNGSSGSHIVGIGLSDSRSKRSAVESDDPFDTVVVKPLEDIGCGCCTNEVICQSFGRDDFLLISLLEGIRELAVSRTHITDDCPLMLRRQPQLEILDLSSNPLLTDGVLDALPHLKYLRSLDLSGTALTGIGLSKLAAFPKLERLVLAGTQLTDSALHELGRLQQLRELDLSATHITGSGFAKLKSLPALEVLTLNQSDITSRGLNTLPAMPALRVLHVRDSQLTDQRIDLFSRCPALEEINLDSTAIGDATFASLGPLQNLKSVSAYKTSVSDDGLQSLRNKQHLESVVVTHTRVRGRGLRYFANCPQLRRLNADRGTNLPPLADADTLQVLAGLRNLEYLNIQLSPTEAAPVPSLRLEDMPLLRRLTIACPPETGDIVLSNMQSLTHLTIRGLLTPDDGYFGRETPLPRPLPRISSIQLSGVGPSDVERKPLDPDRERYLRMHSALELTSVVPDELQLDDLRKLSRLSLTGRITESIRQAFDTTNLRASMTLDCTDGSSPEAALSFVDQFVGAPVPEDGGYGPSVHLRLPRWTDAWSHALERTEGRIARLRVEAKGVGEAADFNLGGLSGLKEVTLAGMVAPHVRMANLSPSLDTINLEQCALGTLTMQNGFGRLRCREMWSFEKLVITAPRAEGRWLGVFRTGQNNDHPRDPFMYAPRELILNDLGSIESVSLNYGPGIRTVTIAGKSPLVREIADIPKTIQSLTANGEDVLKLWQLVGHDGRRKR